ncbi:hypothetical protein B9G69_015720 [Bdellovibrio sp. SKB1291214]|uniref:hypothetical protein n=1 Tax=Bdellovibrio sp. SKB1291214 TaxID=1732569 RepID=UPI00223EC7E3|nr:hypothetical protein [Bdellovibrio sp. SKB1291214]UYL08491.1 hypothetical protein B9G69_015720 [Bdellovibrio sp. SKB1291214]
MILLLPILLLAGILVPEASQAYPDFISYGYNTCITCHYNGQGNGALTDYGRALFTTEIASRAIFNDKLQEDEIAAKSGFLGSTQLPWWVRPGIKYRGLYFQNNPANPAAVNKYVTMQADANVAIQFDRSAKYLLMLSGGYQPTPASRANINDPDNKNFISREHYFRWQVNKKFYTYVGLMDKVFGIRTADHTSYSRSVTDVAQNDQSTGVITQYYADGWEITGNLFVGNLLQEDADIRQKGLSVMMEFDVADKNRLGFAVMQSKNEYVEKTRLEFHQKLGFDKGDSLLTEIGFVKDSPLSAPSDKVGGYLMLQNLIGITRGYNILSQIEYYNATLSSDSTDMFRWSFGLLMFPMPRVEFRAGFVNGRNINDTTVNPDSWMLQSQLHLSL